MHIGHFALPDEDDDDLPPAAIEKGPAQAAPSSITVVWVGDGGQPHYTGSDERQGVTVHYLELLPGVVAAGTMAELREKLGLAGLALADAEREIAREQAEEGKRRMHDRGLA